MPIFEIPPLRGLPPVECCFGHPYDRPAEAVLRDVLGGFVTHEAARAEYGVVVERETVNEDATRDLRARRPKIRRFYRQEYVDALV